MPTDEYSLDDAIKDKWPVPPVSFAINMQFPREGIRYSDLSEEEKDNGMNSTGTRTARFRIV